MRPAFIALAFVVMVAPAAADDLGSFYRSLNSTPHGYTVVDDPAGNLAGTAPAARVERFEVRPGDCAANGGWDDCANDRERSELAQARADRIAPDTEGWYGWSLYLPVDHPNVHPTKTVFGQFHQTRSHPLFMFRQTDAGLILDNQIDKTRHDLLVPDADLRGRWHRFEIHARWSRERVGFFHVYVDGVRRADYRGPTMTADEVYLKYGVYRSFVSRYKDARDADAVPPQVAYFANVRGAKVREALQRLN